MYKCKECGTEYETKPDYCDCGNDTFDEILPEPPAPKNDVTNVTKLNKVEKLKKEKTEPKPEKVEVKTERVEVKPERIEVAEPRNTVQYDYSRLKQVFDPISTSIFGVCVLLAILIVLFAGNSLIKEDSEKTTETPQQTQNLNIPDIDKLWNSTPPKATEQPKQVEEPVQQEEVEPSKPVDLFKAVTKQEPQKQTTKQTAKPQNKSVSQKQTQSTSSPKQVSKPQTNTVAKTQPAQNTAVLKQELLNYKLSLRNRMASRMAFERVVGDGESVVAFKIDASGRLTNRSFAKQSDNDSLNDVVYNAVMQTPTFNAPPKGYKGETLYLKVRMYSGNYEVYLY